MNFSSFSSPLVVITCLCFLCSGCLQQKEETAGSALPLPAVSPTSVELTDQDKSSKFVDSYLKEITTAGDGTGYYCTSENVVFFYSPRKYEILRTEVAGDIAIIRIRLESSTAGGQPIIADRSVYLKKQKPIFSSLLKEAGNYGFCIRSIGEF